MQLTALEIPVPVDCLAELKHFASGVVRDLLTIPSQKTMSWVWPRNFLKGFSACNKPATVNRIAISGSL